MINRHAIIVGLMAVALATSVAIPAAAQHRYQGNGPVCCQTAAREPLSADEAKWLTYMREEEKLARDVYRFLFEKWNLTIFGNISASEDRHFSTVGKLLSRYGLPDPAENRLPGEFSDPSLQALYADLVARGSVSVQAALEAGVLIEQVDIEDLQAALTECAKLDAKRVYTNLLDGSFNHLEAFQTVLEILSLPAAPAN